MHVQVPSIATMSHIDQCWEVLSSSKKEPVGKGRYMDPLTMVLKEVRLTVLNLCQGFSKIIEPFFTLNRSSKVCKNQVQEPTLKHRFFVDSFMFCDSENCQRTGTEGLFDFFFISLLKMRPKVINKIKEPAQH